jgi:hypothetical protein
MRFTADTESLRRASTPAGIIAASYDVFTGVLPVLHAMEDPGHELFTSAVMAAAYAANGRDALAFAPSLTAPRRHQERVDGSGPCPGPGAREIQGLCHVLAGRLTEAARVAEHPGDRAACQEAAGCAAEIAALLGR